MKTKTYNITLDENTNKKLDAIKKHFSLGNKTDSITKCIHGFFDTLADVYCITEVD